MPNTKKDRCDYFSSLLSRLPEDPSILRPNHYDNIVKCAVIEATRLEEENIYLQKGLEDAERRLAALEARNAQLEKRLSSLEASAQLDPETGVYNRAGFRARLEQRLTESKRHHETGSLILLHLDKRQDDKPMTSSVRSSASRRVASILRENLRGSDCIGHIDDDEFGILLPKTDLEGCERCIEKLRTLVDNAPAWSTDGEFALRAELDSFNYTGNDDDSEIVQLI